MKKFIFVLILVFGLTPLAHAGENGPGKKLLRGVTNVLTFPVEVPRQARAYWIEGAQKTPHILVWIFSGTVKGMVEGVKRAGSGVWDIVSFPFDVPENYESLHKPGCVFSDWPRNPETGR